MVWSLQAPAFIGLTLLIRFVLQSDLSNSGWKIGMLYGANTAGAMVGAASTDIVLVPAMGLFGTQAIAVCVNLFAGLGALRLLHEPKVGEKLKEWKSTLGGFKQIVNQDINLLSDHRIRWSAAAIFFAGAVGMIIEVVWIRFFISNFSANRSTFSILLMVMLCGLWLGAMLGGALHKKFSKHFFYSS